MYYSVYPLVSANCRRSSCLSVPVSCNGLFSNVIMQLKGVVRESLPKPSHDVLRPDAGPNVPYHLADWKLAGLQGSFIVRSHISLFHSFGY